MKGDAVFTKMYTYCCTISFPLGSCCQRGQGVGGQKVDEQRVVLIVIMDCFRGRPQQAEYVKVTPLRYTTGFFMSPGNRPVFIHHVYSSSRFYFRY